MNQWKRSAIVLGISLTVLFASSCGSVLARLPSSFPNVYACGFITDNGVVSVYCETVKRPVKVKSMPVEEIVRNRYVCFSPEDTGKIVMWAEEQEQ